MIPTKEMKDLPPYNPPKPFGLKAPPDLKPVTHVFGAGANSPEADEVEKRLNDESLHRHNRDNSIAAGWFVFGFGFFLTIGIMIIRSIGS